MPRATGKVDLGLLLLLAALGAGTFAAVKIAPVYMDNVTVERSMTLVLLDASAMTDEQLRNQLRLKLALIDHHKERDSWGNWNEVTGLQLPDDRVVIDRDLVRNTIRMEVSYDRVVDLAPVPKILAFHFRPVKELPLSH